MKTCSQCSQTKSCEEFYVKQRRAKYPNTDAGISSRCKECCKKITAKNRAKNIARDPNWQKNSDLKHNFGITYVQYNTMLQEQDFQCAICNVHASEFTRSLAVDHCHETGKIRGLLCGSCNLGVGCFADNIERLESTKSYLLSNNTGLAVTSNIRALRRYVKKVG